jgi:hypothetical protein
MIKIDVETRKMAFSEQEQNLANGASTRKKLETEFQKALSRKTPTISNYTLNVSDSILKSMIRKYSEQLVFQPLKEMQFWFSYTSGAFIEPGYPPLYYSRTKGKKVSPNKSAIAGIGEGVAGLIAQRFYKARKLARPNHDFPDIVMKSERWIYLVESKATLSEIANNALSVIQEELPRMVSFTSTCSNLDDRKMTGLLVGTTILNENHYYSYVMEIDIL